MRLGGSIPKAYTTAEAWAEDCRRAGYYACTCPINYEASAEEKKHLLEVAEKNNILLAEVGVWKNTLSLNPEELRANMEYAKKQLAFADEMGISCCVNISGARGEVWDGWYPDNYSPATYELIVDSIREIIDAVKPTRTFYSIEPMPWMVPSSPEEYLKLLRDMDRPQFAVHMDFINMINSVERFLHWESFIRDCFVKLAPWVKSVHIKDVSLDQYALPCCLRECAPGDGDLDYARVLHIIRETMPAQMPVLLEHMTTMEEYEISSRFVTELAKKENIAIDGTK
jgi:sugar phosphate isomerase/epimerase